MGAQYTTLPSPQWARYVDITCIAAGGNGGNGGNGYHKDAVGVKGAPGYRGSYDRRAAGGGGGGSGGYVKIKRLRLGGYGGDGTWELYKGFKINFTGSSITIGNAYNTIATVTNGGNGTNGGSGNTSGDGGPSYGGGQGAYTYHASYVGPDQISTSGAAGGGGSVGIAGAGGYGKSKPNRPYYENPYWASSAPPTSYIFGAGGNGGTAGYGNTGGGGGSAGSMGCVIITYYYNSTDESSIDD